MSDQTRKEIMRLMREEFDPTPPGSELLRGQWDDNAEEVADKIAALFPATTKAPQSDFTRLFEATLTLTHALAHSISAPLSPNIAVHLPRRQFEELRRAVAASVARDQMHLLADIHGVREFTLAGIRYVGDLS